MRVPGNRDVAPQLKQDLEDVHMKCAAYDEAFRLFRRCLFEVPPPEHLTPLEWLPASQN